jgi:hypothetical protein
MMAQLDVMEKKISFKQLAGYYGTNPQESTRFWQ